MSIMYIMVVTIVMVLGLCAWIGWNMNGSNRTDISW